MTSVLNPEHPADGRTAFTLGRLGHAGFVSPDIDASIARWRALGVEEWHASDVLPFDGLYRGRPVSFAIRMAFGYPSDGSLPMELLQPVSGDDWTASAWLRVRGEGLFHLGYAVPNPSEVTRSFRATGGAVDVIEHDAPGAAYAYLDTRATLGVFAETLDATTPWGRDGDVRRLS